MLEEGMKKENIAMITGKPIDEITELMQKE